MTLGNVKAHFLRRLGGGHANLEEA